MRFLEEAPLRLHPNTGKHCIVLDHPHYPNRSIKVFTAYPVDDWNSIDYFYWGDPPKKGEPNMSVDLVEASKIQNICSLYELAPKVYGFCKVIIGERRYIGQVVERLSPEYPKSELGAQIVYEKVKGLGSDYGFANDKDDVSIEDVMCNKLVDFNTFHFTKDHIEIMKRKYMLYAKYGETYYHPVEEWDLKDCPRNNLSRVRSMKLDKLNFTGKSVLDLGCAGGWFCRYAKAQGASNVIGVDEKGHGSPDPVKAAYLIGNELGFWDITYFENNLIEGTFPENGYKVADSDITFFRFTFPFL